MTAPIAYLVARHPKLSETFVRDEVRALEARGETVLLHALVRGNAAESAERSARFPSLRSSLAAQLHWLVRSPRRWLALWGRVLRSHAGSPRRLAQAVLAVGAASEHSLHMRRSGVRHVHAHFATHSALAAWAIGRLTGIPYSFTAHADDIFVPRPMLEDKAREASFVVTISEFNRRYLLRELGDAARSRIRVVHCGVDAEAFAPLPPASADAPFTILCVARLEEKKGQHHLIEACRRLDEKGVALRCWLVGEGAERDRLTRLRDAAGLGGRVELLGALSRDRIRRLMADAHVFALPSVVAGGGRADGIPVALMEAMAMQRPVVSTRTSGIPELVEDGVSGLLVGPGDAQALADALDRLRTDPGRAAELARAARLAVCERFDLHRNAAQLQQLFAQAADTAPDAAALPRMLSRAGVGGAGR